MPVLNLSSNTFCLSIHNTEVFSYSSFSGWTSARYFTTLMLFLGMANAYVMRTNMSVAIVAMVNQTAIIGTGEELHGIDECPSNREQAGNATTTMAPPTQGVIDTCRSLHSNINPVDLTNISFVLLRARTGNFYGTLESRL